MHDWMHISPSVESQFGLNPARNAITPIPFRGSPGPKDIDSRDAYARRSAERRGKLFRMRSCTGEMRPRILRIIATTVRLIPIDCTGRLKMAVAQPAIFDISP